MVAMANQWEDNREGPLSPTCSLTFFECLHSSSDSVAHERASRRIGVEREMKVLYKQPHLVPPMKLTVFDDMPSTPLPTPQSQFSQWISHTRSMASRVSQTASTRKRSSKPVISKPRPAAPPDDLPLRRGREYRPLELSIYAPDNRLSDLPEFDCLSFTDHGEIKFPPRALIRTKSVEVMQTFPSVPVPQKPASMFETRRKSHTRRNTASSIVSTSRPPSEYDALHSHPVSMISLPGLPPQVHMAHRPENSVTILSPMQEEFTPLASAFPFESRQVAIPTEQSICDQHAPEYPQDGDHELMPAPSRLPDRSYPRENVSSSYIHDDYETHERIRHWIGSRQHSSSISTTKSGSTSSSFADHRRKRSQFYQLSTQTPPQPLKLLAAQHQRSITVSTFASTIDTDILCFEVFSPLKSDASLTTAPEVQSRSSTIKSFSLPIQGARINETQEMPPPCYAEVMEKSVDASIVIREIRGPLRSPGVGIAF